MSNQSSERNQKQGQSSEPSPFGRVPNEILRNILSLASQGGLVLHNYAHDRELVPIQLSAVCSRWREAMFDSPRIWSEIRYFIDEIDFEDIDWGFFYETTLLCLEHAGEYPLKLDICHTHNLHRLSFDERLQESCIQAFYPTLDVLIDHASRWESLELSVTQDFFLLPLLEDLQSNLPNLRSLQIRDFDCDTDESGDFDSFLKDCPSLRMLKIELNAMSHRFKLPFHQLHTLDLMDSRDIRSAFAVLRECTNLTHLFFRYSDSEDKKTLDENDHPDQAALLPRLTFLHIGIPYPLFASVLPYIDAPQLENLELTSKSNPSDEDVKYLYRLVRRSPGIVSLTLERTSLTDRHIIQLLRLLPNLTSLTAFLDKGRVLPLEVFDLLGRGEPGETFLPRLTSIRLVAGEISSFEPELLVQAIALRGECQGVEELTSIRLDVDYPTQLPEDLMRLREAGVSIWVDEALVDGMSYL